ncbi:MAG: hypothetical protein EOO62_04465 [Hymenobacter sp.]|nr:MAG: hypothetical protein EOO62_04465 [Hymenobacter sp.]
MAKLVVSPTMLVAKDAQGEKTKWHPDQVARLTIEHQRYTTAQGFSVRKGILSATERKPVFVELLDSGRVSLMRYTYTVRMVGAQGGFMVAGTQDESTVYLIRDAAQPNAVALPVRRFSSREDYFQGLANLLGPYAAQRPDLLKLLNQDQIEDFQLQRFVHALNTNSYF